MNWIKQHKKFMIFLVLVTLFLGWRRYDRHFTPQRWAETDIDHRGKLVRNLLMQYNLEGMTQEEVEALLGTDGRRVQEILHPGENPEKIFSMTYAAGGRPGAIFPEYLSISLVDGRVIQAILVPD